MQVRASPSFGRYFAARPDTAGPRTPGLAHAVQIPCARSSAARYLYLSGPQANRQASLRVLCRRGLNDDGSHASASAASGQHARGTLLCASSSLACADPLWHRSSSESFISACRNQHVPQRRCSQKEDRCRASNVRRRAAEGRFRNVKHAMDDPAINAPHAIRRVRCALSTQVIGRSTKPSSLRRIQPRQTDQGGKHAAIS